MSNCKIQFYSMEGCGYCAKAKTMFAKLINDGVMCVLPHTLANAAADAAGLERPTGFPFFMHTPKNGQSTSHTGCPTSQEELIKALIPAEPFRNRSVVPQRRPEPFTTRCVVPQRRPEPFTTRSVVPQRRPEPFRQQPRASVWQKQYM